MRIGVYGGTFDPIHNGHLRIAEALIGAFYLERLLLVPAFVPPHKRGQAIGSPYHRMAMLALATADAPRIEISTVELEAPSRPYTVETLGLLRMHYPGARLFFVMGSDSFREITLWREYERILKEYDVIVSMRPGVDLAQDPAGHLPAEIRETVADLRGGRAPSEADLASGRIFLTDYVSVDVSSTGIREMAAQGAGIDKLIPPAVAAYIGKYGLYR